MKRRIRVAHVITRLCRGGAQENTFHTVRLANKERFEVDLISGLAQSNTEGSIAERVQQAGISITWEPALVRNVSPWKDVQALLRLTHLFREKKYHIVHTHTSKAGFIGRIAAHRAGVPIIVHTPHGNIFDGYFSPLTTYAFIKMEQFAARHTHCLIELTQRGIEENLSRGIGRPEQWRCVFSGIECSVFTNARTYREATRTSWNVATDHILIGGVGRLEPVKGFSYFVKAAHKVLTRVPHARFLLVGDGTEKDQLLDETKHFGERFRLLGFRDDVPELMAALDVLVVPSINEGMGRVILEAGAAGVPVVATAVGGIPDIVQDGKTGILVPPKDTDALAQAIVLLALDETLRRRMSEEALRYIAPRYSIEAMIKEIETIYEQLIEKQHVVT